MKQDYKIFSDLAIEAHEAARRRLAAPRAKRSTVEPGLIGGAEAPVDESEIDGVEIYVEEDEILRVTRVEIMDEHGAAELGKPIGKYVTIECQRIKEPDPDAHDAAAAEFAKHLGALHGLGKDGVALIVGLGNWKVTADSLGPKVVARTLTTRHFSDEHRELIGEGGARVVCAISPGVMGLTGIETGEIVRGVTEHVKPDLVIAVDALAARRVNRVNSTIQLSNTGINPGAGIGNGRAAINREALGVPVIAVGVPTVLIMQVRLPHFPRRSKWSNALGSG